MAQKEIRLPYFTDVSDQVTAYNATAQAFLKENGHRLLDAYMRGHTGSAFDWQRRYLTAEPDANENGPGVCIYTSQPGAAAHLAKIHKAWKDVDPNKVPLSSMTLRRAMEYVT